MLNEMLSTSRAHPWKIGDDVCSCSPTPLIMGIVNVTPDSFFDGGKYNLLEQAFDHARTLVEEGAAIIDVGGESSRPGCTPVPLQEELDRVCPLIEKLAPFAQEMGFYISVDTVKSQVAAEAMRLGAHIINDISALSFDPCMAQTVASARASVILNHIRGNLGTMQQDFKPYGNVVREVHDELMDRVLNLLALGVEPQRICIDPGIGFGKDIQDNITLMKSIEEFLEDGYPILVGTSRKSYIGKMKGLEKSDRLIPTVTAGIIATLGGASCIRVHDVKEAKESMLYLEALNRGSI